MMFRVFIFAFFIFLSAGSSLVNQAPAAPAPESDQQISEFSLSGYGEKGRKAWDLAGKTADIFDSVIKLKDVTGNLYGEDEDIKLTADNGDFDKTEGKVHLEKNVVITTSSGAVLTTEAMDWDRKRQVVSTDEMVNIVRDNMVTNGTGAVGKPNLSRVVLQKDVQVDINPKEGAQQTNKIVITCDGPLEVDYAKNIATFKNNVKVDTQDNLIYSDIMNVYFLTSSSSGAKETKKEEKKETKKEEKKEENKDNNKDSGGFASMGSKIEKIVATGNVKIIKGQNISYCQEATYTASDRKIVLTGRPQLIIYSNSTEGMDAPFGN